jgi:hypothetical protein
MFSCPSRLLTPVLAGHWVSDPVIKLVNNNNLSVGPWFSYNRLVLNFQNLITYLDDPIIIHAGYQSLNTNKKFIKKNIFFSFKKNLEPVVKKWLLID